jgi:hypothetical protein
MLPGRALSKYKVIGRAIRFLDKVIIHTTLMKEKS